MKVMNNYSPIIKPINQQVKEKCWNYLKTHNLANRGEHDGNKENQLIGLLAEMETCFLLKDFYPDLNLKKNEFDGGFDIKHMNRTIDVKAMGRNFYTRSDYVNNFAKLQLKYKCDILLFTSVNKKTNYIEFCGWIWKKEIKERAIFYEKGCERPRGKDDTMITTTDNYEIKNSNLRDIRYLLEINIQEMK